MATAVGSREVAPRVSVKWRYTVAIFAGSLLLFLVQPMVARMALPRLGGAPAVWNSAMLVYQLLLLGGYAYAHWLGRFAARTQASVHLTLLIAAATMLPIGLISGAPSPHANMFLWVPWLLVLSIGPLFLALSAQAPLLQRWYANTGGRDPYPLYAASNLGSFGGLIAYPLLVEPALSSAKQSFGWSIGYGAVVLLAAACAVSLPKREEANSDRTTGTKAAGRDVTYWIAIAAIPSGLMLSTTLHITTDVVAIPLLWVFPLGLYLLSFTVAFAEKRGASKFFTRLAPVTLIAAAAGVFMESAYWLPFVAAAIVNLFVIAVALHTALFDKRPHPTKLTQFYLCLAIGGAIGGLVGALLAPLIFDWTYEHPIWMIAAALALPARSPFRRWVTLWDGDRMSRRIAFWGAVVVLLISTVGQPLFDWPQSPRLVLVISLALLAVAIFAIGSRTLLAASIAALMLTLGGWQKLGLSLEPGRMERSFFGIYSIEDTPEGDARFFFHGTTVHGIQLRGSAKREMTPASYYSPSSGAGLVFHAVPELFGATARIGVVGLGAGALACYGKQGQHWTFFEIDPAVVDAARDPHRFTFLKRCQPRAPIVIGDGRLALEDMHPNSFDILVADAFSSDSVPQHLLTQQAFATYRRALSEDGLLLVHVSNRYLDLKPVVAGAAANGWTARYRKHSPSAEEARFLRSYASEYIVLSSPATIERLENAGPPGGWQYLGGRRGFAPWTDDYGSILPVLKILH